MSRWPTPSLCHASLTQVSSAATPGSLTHTHAAHTLNTVPFPLIADSSTLGSGATPSQQSKVCSDADQTEAAAASSLEEKEASITDADRREKAEKDATLSDWSQKPTDCVRSHCSSLHSQVYFCRAAQNRAQPLNRSCMLIFLNHYFLFKPSATTSCRPIGLLLS